MHEKNYGDSGPAEVRATPVASTGSRMPNMDLNDWCVEEKSVVWKYALSSHAHLLGEIDAGRTALVSHHPIESWSGFDSLQLAIQVPCVLHTMQNLDQLLATQTNPLDAEIGSSELSTSCPSHPGSNICAGLHCKGTLPNEFHDQRTTGRAGGHDDK